MREKIFAAFIAVVLSAPASAWTVQYFLDHVNNETERELLRFYITGLGDGYMWASALNKVRGGKELYCPPEKMALQTDNFIQIVRSRIKEHPQDAQQELGLVLSASLIATFPCQEPRNP